MPGEPADTEDSEPLSADLAQSLIDCVRALLLAESELRDCWKRQELDAGEAKLEQWRQQVAPATGSLSGGVVAAISPVLQLNRLS